MTGQATLAPEETQSKAGKYLTFALADEEYGLEILKVREIISMMEITGVPRTPHHVKGVINLRGKVIPVVDLRLKVGLAEAERTEETCIIVVDIGDLEMGIVVDRVLEVLDIAGEDIEDAPSLGPTVNTDFILGMGKAEKKVTILLNISKLLTKADISDLEATRQFGQSDRAGCEMGAASPQNSKMQESREQPEQEHQEQPQEAQGQ